MQAIHHRNLLIGLYLSILSLLLLSVVATPFLIRHGIPLTRDLIVGEDAVESALIGLLCLVSFFILRSLLHAMRTYRHQAERAARETSRLTSRLTDAFDYIGTVNVEIQEAAALLCGVTCYPQSRKAFKQLVDHMAARAMAIAVVPWLVVRMIDRRSGQTLGEHAVQRPCTEHPTAILGNRAILDDRPMEGMRTIRTRQRNLDILTVFILPTGEMADEQAILLGAILNQLEMLFLLYRSGCLRPPTSTAVPQKEINHATRH